MPGSLRIFLEAARAELVVTVQCVTDVDAELAWYRWVDPDGQQYVIVLHFVRRAYPMISHVNVRRLVVLISLIQISFGRMSAQSPSPYPNAIVDRLIHDETPMRAPKPGTLFRDPDFHTWMVRVSDENTNFRLPGTFLRTVGNGETNMWSSDGKKFYIVGGGGWLYTFAFDPSRMKVSSLPNAAAGKGLLLPLRHATFSFVDPDLVYGTTAKSPLTIATYRFSTKASMPLFDTTRCDTHPALISAPGIVSDDDLTSSANDARFAISEGGPHAGAHMFIVVYDKNLGCRWYNTETGEVGGQWGPAGSASTTDRYPIRHAYLSKNGRYVRILVDYIGFYVWDVTDLKVTPCYYHGPRDRECNGYGALGYSTFVNGPAVTGAMQVSKRPLNSLGKITELIYPNPLPLQFDYPLHFTWSNDLPGDTTPVCASNYNYEGESSIDRPYAGEIFCIETDGTTSTIWRFAHNRAKWVQPFFNTQPSGSISRDGRWFLFTSDWDGELGVGADGMPRSDVFILKLR